MTATRAAEAFPPGDFIREELQARGWTQSDLAYILGRPLNRVNEIINGKRAVTPQTAKALASAFGTTPELWMNLETAYQLWRDGSETEPIARRARAVDRGTRRNPARRRVNARSERQHV